jgi:hypothetical protein
MVHAQMYKVRFTLAGGATVTKVILAISEQDAGKRARRLYNAAQILAISKV